MNISAADSNARKNFLIRPAIPPNRQHSIFPVFLLAPDKSIELVSEYPPAATDFLSLYFACGDIFEVSRAGNFEIKAGFLRVQNYAIIAGVYAGIRPSLKTVATVRCFTAILAPAMLHHTFISHKSNLENRNTIR
jgi:hypothetical protein